MNCSPKQTLPTGTWGNNSGLTQELQNLEITKKRVHCTSLNNPEERTKYQQSASKSLRKRAKR